MLVVEEVTPTTASVIYAWGQSAAWNVRPGYSRHKGTIENNVLVVKMPRPATATYRMQPDGTLDATYEWTGSTARATLRKTKQ